MKNNIMAGLALLTAFAATSCNGFLDEDPKGQSLPENYFRSQEDVQMSLVSLYDKVYASQNNSQSPAVNFMGDDVTTNSGSNKQAYAEIDRFSASNNNKCLTDTWNYPYGWIKAANFIINGVEKAPASKEEINIAMGNAKYWRASGYFRLVRAFGPVPLNLDNVNDDYKDQPATIEQVYAQIEKDLLEAIPLLPTGYSGTPRNINGCDVFITKQAAQATLGAVYMAMAGYPLGKAECYAKAAEVLKEVIDGNHYTLDSDFREVYSMGNNWNKETVVGYSYNPILGSWRQDSELTSCGLYESLGGWGDSWAEIKYWKNYPEGPRKDAVYSPMIRLKDGTLVNWWDKDGEGKALLPEYHPMFSVFTSNASDEAGAVQVEAPYDYTKQPYLNMTDGHRHRIIRYAEVLLWYAEAVGRSGQTNALAIECLNKVRNRAYKGVEGYEPVTSLTPAELAEMAYNEHGWEVAGYWVALVTRRDDQLRTNTLKDVFADRKANAGVEVAPGVVVTEPIAMEGEWTDARNYLPYPEGDSSKNPALVH